MRRTVSTRHHRAIRTPAPSEDAASTPLLALMHPAWFAAGYVLLSFNNLPTPASGLWRPLAIAMVVSLLLSLLLAALTRRRALGALLATSVVLAVSALWLLVGVVAVTISWVGLVTLLRRIRAAPPLRFGIVAANRLVGVFGAMFALVAVVSAASPVLESLPFPIPTSEPLTSDQPPPNVYLILLDGYPRQDVLNEYLGYDNSDFEASLTATGFDLASSSRSNYTATWATLASMFHGEYLEDIDSLPTGRTNRDGQYAGLMKAINAAPALGKFRAQGYRIVTVPSPFEGAALVSADEVRAGGQLTSFELSLLRHSGLLYPLLSVAPEFPLDQQRLRIEDALAAIVDVAEESRSGPTFMFTHVLSPHPPIVFRADGRLAELPSCYPSTCTLWQMAEPAQWAGFTGQIEHLNDLVIKAVGGVVAADPKAVVVIMSDHGSQPPGAPDDVLLENLFAVRSPEHPELGTSDIHPVDLLATISDGLFATNLPRHTYRGWLNLAEEPLQMVEVDPADASAANRDE